MEIPTKKGVAYIATCTQACTIEAIMSDGTLMFLASAPEAGQVSFIAISGSVSVSDANAYVAPFMGASLSALGGGSTLELDDVPTAGSENGVTSNGVYVATLHNGGNVNSVVLGNAARCQGGYCVALGTGSYAGGNESISLGSQAASVWKSIAVGRKTKANGKESVAVGYEAQALAFGSAALGAGAVVNDEGVFLISAHNEAEEDDSSTRTSLYLIGANTPLAETYCENQAALGYTVEVSGAIVERGTVKLSELMPDNATTFTPTEA